ncbi:flagellar hook-length control protein FliK [Halomonas mongoliensis]|uniref:Flagellar hook-length control protein FliK n=1 Tax=Halomonas mongoliensis TaxID=321265 RepID=A0ABU1GNE3_9GAMM|nr:flagellar hook-length control protein FliK [Halomonas mongoliensis]MDR5893350.1 flagellar hook-length control protein FliK [Halomonas mongoliensis]
MDIALLLSTIGDQSRPVGAPGGRDGLPSQGFADTLAGLQEPLDGEEAPSPAQLSGTAGGPPLPTAMRQNLVIAAGGDAPSPTADEGALADITRRLQLIASAGDGVADLADAAALAEGRLDLQPHQAPLTLDAHPDVRPGLELGPRPDERSLQAPRLDGRPDRRPGMQPGELPFPPRLLRTVTADAVPGAPAQDTAAMATPLAMAADAIGHQGQRAEPAAPFGQETLRESEARQALQERRAAPQAAASLERAPLDHAARQAVTAASGPQADTPLPTGEPRGEPRPEGVAHLTAQGAAGSTAATAGTASAASASQASLAAPLTSPAWPAQLGQQMVLLGQRGGEQRAELHLNPAELGPLTISLKVSEQGAQAQFLSAHASVRQAVEQAIPQLREALAEQGISLGEASVGEQRQQGQEQRQAFAGGAPPSSSASDSAEIESLIPVPAPDGQLIEAGRVDLYA